MKKAVAIALMMVMLLSAAAFAEAADFLGVWYLIDIEAEGMSYRAADIGMSMMIELKEDGAVYSEFSMGGDTEAGEGTWTLNGDTVTVTIEDSAMDYTLRDGALTADDDGRVMVFGREPVEAEPYTPAGPVAAGEPDFAGSWTAFKYGMDGFYMDAAAMGMDMVAEFTDGSLMLTGFYGSDEPIPVVFADGAYSYETDDESEMFSRIEAEMLEDGNLMLTLTAGDTAFVLVMAPTEAPAA